jgi:hypothetical protein
MVEEIHVAFWTYRLTYFDKIGVLSRAYRMMERKFIEVLRLQGMRKAIARFLNHNREEEEAVEGFAKKCRVSVQQAVRFVIKYAVCLPLGLVTCGLFWTKDMKKFVFYNRSDMGSDESEMRRKETESLKEDSITLLQLQEKQSEQTIFVLAQLASVREENSKLVELQMEQSEKIADMSQKLAEAMVMLEETCLRLGSIKQESPDSPSEEKS